MLLPQPVRLSPDPANAVFVAAVVAISGNPGEGHENQINSTRNARAILEDHDDDPVVEELTSFINCLSEDEQIDLVALTWLGRDDYSASDWRAVRAEAARAHNKRTADYLLGTPLLADFLEEGLSLLGRSCKEFEFDHLS